MTNWLKAIATRMDDKHLDGWKLLLIKLMGVVLFGFPTVVGVSSILLILCIIGTELKFHDGELN